MLREIAPADVGRRLKRLRRSVGWSQRDLAAEIGESTNHSSIARLEQGMGDDIGFNRLASIARSLADALEMDPEEVWNYLLWGEPLTYQMSYSRYRFGRSPQTPLQSFLTAA